MNNNDENQLAMLLNNGVCMEIIAGEGGVFGTYSYEFSIYIPTIQKHFTGLTGCNNLDDYDGIHQMDFDTYVGIGYSVKDAYDRFIEANTGIIGLNIGDYFFENDSIEKYAQKVIAWEELPEEDRLLKRLKQPR